MSGGEGAITRELLELERQGWDALCRSTGADFYGRLMLPDGLMILAHGFALSREEVVASLNDAPPWSRYEISDARVMRLAADAAVLVYRGTAWRDADDPEFHAWMASTYVKRDGEWALSLYQQTPIPNMSATG